VDINREDSKFSTFLPPSYGHFLELHNMQHLAYSSYEQQLKCYNTNSTKQIIAQVRQLFNFVLKRNYNILKAN